MGRAGTSSDTLPVIDDEAAEAAAAALQTSREEHPEPTFAEVDSALAGLARFSYSEFVETHLNPRQPQLVTSTSELRAVIDEITALQTPTLGVDCEIAGMETIETERTMVIDGVEKVVPSDELVGGQLRLVQLAVHSRSAEIAPKQWLVDCFAVDPKPLEELLYNRKLQKVIHWADFEQRQLMEKLDLAEPIGPIYDTCRAWMSTQKFLRNLTEEERAKVGFEHWSRYKNELRLVSHHLLGFPLPKDERESDWGVETLSDEQLEYAAMDVAVLMPIASRIKYVVRTLGLQKKVRAHIYRANQEVVGEVLAARAAALEAQQAA